MENMNKKVLLISNMYPSKRFPHYGIFVKNIHNILKKHGFVVDCILLKKHENKVIKLVAYFCFYCNIIVKILINNYSIIYGHYASHISFPLLVVSKIKKNLNIVVNVHGNDIVPEDKNDLKFIPYVKILLAKCNNIIAPSDYFKNILISEYGIDGKKIFVFPSGGVDMNIFHEIKDKEKIYKKYGLDVTKKHIGYISRIEEKKGWDVFLKSVKEILLFENDIEFIVVGDGSQKSDYIQLKSELGLTNVIKEFQLLPQENVCEIFNILDIFCFPTYRKSESLGLVGLESMACNTIVICSDQYGPSSYIKNEINGFTFKTGDEMSLSNTILKVINLDKGMKSQIKKNAIQTAGLYKNDRIELLLVEHLKKMM